MFRATLVFTLASLSLLLTSSAWAVDGQVECEIRENGEAATGTVVLLDGTREVAQGSCGQALRAPAGSYTAVLRLDGAIDGPEQRMPVTVAADKPARLQADFATGTLEVRVTSQGRAAASMAILRKDGKQIGTLGSGVPAHLSVGNYEVVVRYRSAQQSFPAVAIARGEKKTLDVTFE